MICKSSQLISFKELRLMHGILWQYCVVLYVQRIPYLLSFFSNSRTNKNFKSLPETSERLLRKTVVMQQRKEIPTDTEICAILVYS